MDIFEYFRDTFTLYTNEAFSDCDLTDEDKEILCVIGLPEKPLSFLQFNVNASQTKTSDGSYVIIGSDGEAEVCIAANGEVIAVDAEHEYPDRYMNAGLKYLLEFIRIIRSYEEQLIEASDDEAKILVNEIRERFNYSDHSALRNAENWWAVILEQIETGLM